MHAAHQHLCQRDPIQPLKVDQVQLFQHRHVTKDQVQLLAEHVCRGLRTQLQGFDGAWAQLVWVGRAARVLDNVEQKVFKRDLRVVMMVPTTPNVVSRTSSSAGSLLTSTHSKMAALLAASHLAHRFCMNMCRQRQMLQNDWQYIVRQVLWIG